MRSVQYFLVAIGLLAAPGLAAQQKTPNILYIMSDDHSAEALGIYGGRLAALDPTPNLDRLAKEGMVFDNCLATNSLCTPSRASIITGQYSQANGVLELNQPLPTERHYLPQEMKKLGYQTALVGKWHLVSEPGFDYYCTMIGQGEYFDPVFNLKSEKPWPNSVINTKGHSSDVVTDITIDWLKNKRDKSKPFLLMHHFKAPHDMFEFAPRYRDYLQDVFIPEPASLYYNAGNGSAATKGEGGNMQHLIGASLSHRDTLWGLGRKLGISADIPDPEYRHLVYQEYLRRYLRCVKGIDDNIQRLIATLKEEGLWDNTIIIYTSDQGYLLGEHDYMDKRWMYEESMRMPLIVRYPAGIPAGTRSQALVANVDFAPTLIALAGGKAPARMQGHSFAGILSTGSEPANWQQAIYYRYWMHMAHDLGTPAHFGIRTKDYKLIFFYGRYWVDGEEAYKKQFPRKRWDKNYGIETPAGWELYDLRKDPQEMNNVYHDPAYKDIIIALKKELAAQRKALHEEDTAYPHIQQVIDRHWND